MNMLEVILWQLLALRGRRTRVHCVRELCLPLQRMRVKESNVILALPGDGKTTSIKVVRGRVKDPEVGQTA